VILSCSEEVKVGSAEIGRPHLDATAQVEAAVILEASKSKVKREFPGSATSAEL